METKDHEYPNPSLLPDDRDEVEHLLAESQTQM
jgi:hypothetical protein